MSIRDTSCTACGGSRRNRPGDPPGTCFACCPDTSRLSPATAAALAELRARCGIGDPGKPSASMTVGEAMAEAARRAEAGPANFAGPVQGDAAPAQALRRKPRKRPSHPPESAVLRDCLSLLRQLGIPHWRANCGAAKQGDRYVRFGTPGQPDVMGLIPPAGRLLACECKSRTGRLRPAQSAWLERARQAGAVVCVARSADELREALRASGVQA